MEQLSEDFMKVINRVANEVLNPPASQTKGTSYWYNEGSVGNKTVQHTKAKTYYNNRFGFWSWIATKYKDGRIKRTRFALSGSRKKCEARAERLLLQLKGEL